ncbi:expressed unknown protein [Seminavis robusta]|uniref:Uncharacterized protein n=1 Tax=Seminavis robusta TaxID=568900 RepID=A0A9N8HSI5_9STRA|nr:expressed unknown protein [Seminavis robusta]|eukprot:Sro1389_g268600.1 n/a (281) ;mRNA; r:25880-26722
MPESVSSSNDAPSSSTRHGQWIFTAIMLLSFAAFLLSLSAAGRCNFANRWLQFRDSYTVEDLCTSGSFVSQFEIETCFTIFRGHSVGFDHWSVTTDNGQVCLAYVLQVPLQGWVAPEFDNLFKSAYGFAILACVFGAFGLFTILCATCCPLAEERVRGMAGYFFLATICQGLAFLIFPSNVCQTQFFEQYYPSIDVDPFVRGVKCDLGHGAKMAITAAVLYFVCMLLCPLASPIMPFGYKRLPCQDNAGPMHVEELTEKAIGDAPKRAQEEAEAAADEPA